MKLKNKTSRFAKPFAAAAVMILCAGPASAAYTTFFGRDNNPTPGSPATYPNSVAAESNFKSNLVGVGTETFESFPTTATSPLSLTFPGAGGATLTATDGLINSVSPPAKSNGRFPTSGTKYWSINVTTGQFFLEFAADVAAFGFYATDVGDFGGDLSLQITKSGGSTDTLTVSSGSQTDGGVLYFGLIAGGAADVFKRIDFLSTGGTQNETFGYDDMTIGALNQVCRPPECATVPTPGTLPLAVLAMLGLGIGLARRPG